jgi:hypothetical protein
MPLSFARRSCASPSADPTRERMLRVAAGLRYQGGRARHGHVESWFLKANDPRSRRAIWLKWTVWASDRNPTAAIAEVWAIAFGAQRGNVAAKAAAPFESATFDAGGLGAAVDGCTLTPEAARGRVETGDRAIGYDLTIETLARPLLHYPASWMYSGPWPSQKVASPIPSARITGRVEVDGEIWSLERWPGMVGHNWGRRHAVLYAWAQCNVWDDEEDVVFEGVSVGSSGSSPAATLLCLRSEGASHDLNGMWSLSRNEGSITPRRLRFHGRSRSVEIDGEMWAETDDFVGLFYPNPDGTMCHCLNTKLARAEVRLIVAGRPRRTLRSSRAALEIGTRDPGHGVRMYL